jgi:hypothetical protein
VHLTANALSDEKQPPRSGEAGAPNQRSRGPVHGGGVVAPRESADRAVELRFIILSISRTKKASCFIPVFLQNSLKPFACFGVVDNWIICH